MSTTERTVLLTLGRLPPSVEIARSFHAAGWKVIVAEPFRWHMARTSRAVSASFRVPAPVEQPEAYQSALLEIIREQRVSLVVPVSEETMHVVGLRDRLPAGCDLFASGSALTRRLHSKLGFTRLAGAAGLDVPMTYRANAVDRQDMTRIAEFIEKPEFSCSGREVTRWPAGTARPPSQTMIVQQAINGREYSAFAIAKDGIVLGQIVYKAIVRHGSVAVVFERVERPSIDAWLARLVEHVGHSGFIAVDVIVSESGQVFGIECNPRATSGIHFFENRDIEGIVTGTSATGRVRPDSRLQEFWSALTHWFSVIGDRQERQSTRRAIRTSRDVSWHHKDPLVFLLATFSSWSIIRRARKHKTDFASVLALDIEWRADHES